MSSNETYFKRLFKKSDIWISLVATTLSVVFLSGYLVDIVSLKTDRKSGPTLNTYEKEYFMAIDRITQIGDSSTVNIETFKKVFNSIDRKSEGLLFNYGFTNVLEDYSVKLIQDSSMKSTENLKLVLNVIENELNEEPFNQLPPEQRRLLVNLKNNIDDADQESASYNLNELNNILRIRNENFTELERQNAWSIPLAIAGLFLTLAFGVLSLIKSLKRV